MKDGQHRRPPVVRSVGVTAAGVADIRRRVTDAARAAGLDEERADGLTLAVNEVVANAIQHGGGTAEVTITPGDNWVVVVVRDRGPGIRAGPPGELPPPGQVNGRRLWLAAQLCDEIAFHNTEAGTRIRLTVTA
jgi:anti-sigma regulatory factor (Ser/Thr protein kinase)